MLIGLGSQLAAPLAAHAARRPHCAAVPVPGQPGTFVIKCSVQRP
jgi:hypothetical protein